VWTPKYSAGGTDIHQRVQELAARIRMMSDQRRSAAPGSPAASFASAMTANAPPHDAHSPHLRDLESHKPKALPDGRDRAQRARQTVAPTMVNISTPVLPAVAPPPGLGATQVEPDYFEDIDEEIPLDYVIENQAVGRGPTPPPSSSSSSSTSSSSSSGGKNKKKKKLKKKKRKITVPYKVKAGEIKLPAWPTATGFPAWRRTLRQAVISASDRPERARPWIFAVETDDVSMEDLHCADDDRHRTLDAKLAEALTKILKGELLNSGVPAGMMRVTRPLHRPKVLGSRWRRCVPRFGPPEVSAGPVSSSGAERQTSCSTPGSVPERQTSCSTPGSVPERQTSCSTPGSVPERHTSCTTPAGRTLAAIAWLLLSASLRSSSEAFRV